MNTRVQLGRTLIAVGLVTLAALLFWHFYAAAHHQLGSFDDAGLSLLFPFLGTVCVGAGVFLLALSGNPPKR